MPVPDNPTGERERLRELLSLDILDTLPEQRFDRYTQLVADVFAVPIALISLVDDKRQWFKSRVGLEFRETSRDVSFCAHALSARLLEIPDTHLDERFANNPLVQESPHIRFYAGAVLRGPTGKALGTLCILDRRPRRLSERQRQRLTAFAELVEQELMYNAVLSRTRQDIFRAALLDPLTGFPGPLMLEGRSRELMEQAKNGDVCIAALSLRPNRVDEINRIYGRSEGDALFSAIAARLRNVAPTHAEIARGTGAWFVILLPYDSDSDYVHATRRIVADLCTPFTIGSRLHNPGFSVGIARAPEDAQYALDLLKRSRRAARDVTSTNPDYVGYYSEETDARLERRHCIARRIPEAADNGSLSLLYQPIYGLADDQIASLEALTRWHDSELGSVSPDEFIPIVERDPVLRRAFTIFVLRTACSEALSWSSSGVHLNVNISAHELHDPDFASLFSQIVREVKFDPRCITIELTEESLITDVHNAKRTLDRITALGTNIAIDDFGTGYSSLSYLQTYPVHCLKIDSTFVHGLHEGVQAIKLVGGIVDIGKSLGMCVVAEGVETESQKQMLIDLGCRCGQGFLLGRPVSATDIPELLRTQAGLE